MLLYCPIRKLHDTNMDTKDSKVHNKEDAAMYHVYLYKFFLAAP